MNFYEIFTSGRDAQRKYLVTQQRKQVVLRGRKPQKLPSWHPAQIIRGAGVLYEMVHPKLAVIYEKWILPAINVIRIDLLIIGRYLKIVKPPQEYEDYRNFLELTRGKNR